MCSGKQKGLPSTPSHAHRGTNGNTSPQVPPQPGASRLWRRWLNGQAHRLPSTQAALPPPPSDSGQNPERGGMNHRGRPSRGLCPGNTGSWLERSQKPAAVTGRPQVLELGCWRGIQRKQALVRKQTLLRATPAVRGWDWAGGQAGALLHLATIRVFTVTGGRRGLSCLPRTEGAAASTWRRLPAPSAGPPGVDAALGQGAVSGALTLPCGGHDRSALLTPSFPAVSPPLPLHPEKIHASTDTTP